MSALSIYTLFNIYAIQPPLWSRMTSRSSSNKGSTTEYHVSSPDLQIVPRFALSETENSAQSVDITFRLPTSDVINNQSEAPVPLYYNLRPLELFRSALRAAAHRARSLELCRLGMLHQAAMQKLNGLARVQQCVLKSRAFHDRRPG